MNYYKISKAKYNLRTHKLVRTQKQFGAFWQITVSTLEEHVLTMSQEFVVHNLLLIIKEIVVHIFAIIDIYFFKIADGMQAKNNN